MKAPVMGIIGQERKKTIDFLQNALSKNMYFRTSDKKECSGCTACVNACPQSCISMELNSGGFAYPLIDKNTCINCGICEKYALSNTRHTTMNIAMSLPLIPETMKSVLKAQVWYILRNW